MLKTRYETAGWSAFMKVIYHDQALLLPGGKIKVFKCSTAGSEVASSLWWLWEICCFWMSCAVSLAFFFLLNAELHKINLTLVFHWCNLLSCSDPHQHRKVLWVLFWGVFFVAEVLIYKLAGLRKTPVFQGYMRDTSNPELLGFGIGLADSSNGFYGCHCWVLTPVPMGGRTAGAALCSTGNLKCLRV